MPRPTREELLARLEDKAQAAQQAKEKWLAAEDAGNTGLADGLWRAHRQALEEAQRAAFLVERRDMEPGGVLNPVVFPTLDGV